MTLPELLNKIPTTAYAFMLLPAYMWCVKKAAQRIGRRIEKWPDSKLKRALLWDADAVGPGSDSKNSRVGGK